MKLKTIAEKKRGSNQSDSLKIISLVEAFFNSQKLPGKFGNI